MDKKFKYKDSDDGFKEGSLCCYEGCFAKVINIENGVATIEKTMPKEKEDLYFFTSSNEPDIYEPVKIYPSEYELILEPHPEYRIGKNG